MLFIIYGNQNFLINRTLNKLKRNYSQTEVFEYKSDINSQIIFSISSYSLFTQKKLIIIKNSEFLLNNDEEIISIITKDLFDILTNNEIENDIALLLHSSKISKNSIVDYALKNGKIIENLELTESDWIKYANTKFEKANIKITQDAINELISRSEHNLDKFENEFNKLILYKDNLKIDDIKLLVTEPLEENSFQVLNYLMNNNKTLAIKKYRKLVKENYETIVLISSIATQLKFYKQVFYLKNIYSNEEISKILKTNEKRIFVTNKNLNKIGIDKINKSLENLFLLDKQIKSGNLNKILAFEMFLINF